jgi:hypothetical protein
MTNKILKIKPVCHLTMILHCTSFKGTGSRISSFISVSWSAIKGSLYDSGCFHYIHIMLQNNNRNLTQAPSNSGLIFITLPIKLLFMSTTKGRKVPDESHITTFTLMPSFVKIFHLHYVTKTISHSFNLHKK